MMKSLVAAFALCTALCAPLPVMAKGANVKITITSPGHSAPTEITDPAIREFHVWSGPGAKMNGVPERTGFIGDWERGPVDEPAPNLSRHRVEFYTGCKVSDDFPGCTTEVSQLSYVVFYVYDSDKKEGYVYLPGRGEPSYELNTRSILRGIEGKWFPATRSWQTFAARFVADVK